MHGSEAPSAWVRRWSHLVPAQGTVLDVACGTGKSFLEMLRANYPDHTFVDVD